MGAESPRGDRPWRPSVRGANRFGYERAKASRDPVRRLVSFGVPEGVKRERRRRKKAKKRGTEKTVY